MTNIVHLKNHSELKLSEALGEGLRYSECLGTSVIGGLKTLPVYLPFTFYGHDPRRLVPKCNLPPYFKGQLFALTKLLAS